MVQKFPLGPSDWPDWIKFLIPGKKKFAHPAIAHDYLYEFCENEEDRKKADIVFLELCLEDSTSILWETWACVLYLAVRVGGRNRIGKK